MYTEQQIKDAIYDATKLIYPSVSKIMYAWQDVKVSLSSPNEPAIYMSLVLKDDPYSYLRDINYVDKNDTQKHQTQMFTRVYECTWHFYGNTANDMANSFINNFLTPEVRSILRKTELFPLSSIASPQVVPFLHNGQWFTRVDVIHQLNNQVFTSATIETLQSADVTIKESAGADVLVEVREIPLSLEFEEGGLMEFEDGEGIAIESKFSRS